MLNKSEILLGQMGGNPQGIESVSCPEQFLPPNIGLGSLHSRIRIFSPFPHDTEHLPKPFHCPQLPSTEIKSVYFYDFSPVLILTALIFCDREHLHTPILSADFWNSPHKRKQNLSLIQRLFADFCLILDWILLEILKILFRLRKSLVQGSKISRKSGKKLPVAEKFLIDLKFIINCHTWAISIATGSCVSERFRFTCIHSWYLIARTLLNARSTSSTTFTPLTPWSFFHLIWK